VKRLLEPMGRSRFGFLAPDGGGKDVYFNERRIGSNIFGQLELEQRVAAIIVETDRGFEAHSIFIRRAD
jgi:cold shock CspA family protein